MAHTLGCPACAWRGGARLGDGRAFLCRAAYSRRIFLDERLTHLSVKARGLARNVLAWLGQRSFAIYVSHFFFITATRIILLHFFGISNFAVHLPVAFAAGLAGSLALLVMAQRLGFAPLLGFGTPPDTRLQRSAKAVAVA